MLTKYEDVRPTKRRKKPFEKCFHICGVFRNFFRERAPNFDIFKRNFSSRNILKHLENKKDSRGGRGHAPPENFTYCSGHFNIC